MFYLGGSLRGDDYILKGLFYGVFGALAKIITETLSIMILFI